MCWGVNFRGAMIKKGKRVAVGSRAEVLTPAATLYGVCTVL